MNDYNPMLEDVGDTSKGKTVDKTFIVTAKADDGKYYYVLSKGMQSSLAEYEKGDKQVNTKGNPVMDKYKKFTVKGKEYYGVDKKDYGAVGSNSSKWFDTYEWRFDTKDKTAKYYKGETELADAFDKMDVPKGYEGYTKEESIIDDKMEFGEIPL